MAKRIMAGSIFSFELSAVREVTVFVSSITELIQVLTKLIYTQSVNQGFLSQSAPVKQTLQTTDLIIAAAQ